MDTRYLDIERKLHDFFSTNSKGVVISSDLTVAVFKISHRNGVFFAIFDPHSRNEYGQPAENGLARVTFHTNIRSVTNTITSSYYFTENSIKSIQSSKDPLQKIWVQKSYYLAQKNWGLKIVGLGSYVTKKTFIQN